MAERSRLDPVNAAISLALAAVLVRDGLTSPEGVAAFYWWNASLMVVLATLHTLKYTSATFRGWLENPKILGGVAVVAFVLTAVLFSFHGSAPAWMFALVGIVAALAALGEWMGPKPLLATRWAQVAALVVAVGFVAFGASFLTRSLDRSSVAAATLSAAAGLVVAWLALRWRRADAWAE